MILAAITGSIGCGKTTLANIFKKLGYPVFDADAWVRRLYFKPDFIKVVLQNFPEAQTNGSFDKRKLRLIVFDDKKKLQKLESLIHPFLKRQLKAVIRKNAQNDDLLFLDAALLFELGWDKYCDFIITVNVSASDAAKLENETEQTRDNNSDTVGVSRLFGYLLRVYRKVKQSDQCIGAISQCKKHTLPNIARLHKHRTNELRKLPMGEIGSHNVRLICDN